VKTLVIAPHPDDEILGCGGTLLRRAAEGVELGWLIVTEISTQHGWPGDKVEQREREISQVAAALGCRQVFNLKFPAMRLDALPMSDLVEKFSDVFRKFQPEEVLLPHRGDIHSDHRVVFDAAAACTKWFRYPSIRRVLAYETVSETEAALAGGCVFQPDWFVDVSQFMARKLQLAAIYESELGIFPFPRSAEAIDALAKVRGMAAGVAAAEAFQLLRQRE